MNREELRENWKREENLALSGRDLSPIEGGLIEEELPWDYRARLKEFLKPHTCLLDMGTVGGEFLLSLKHPFHLTSVTEGYEPDYELCLKKLSPLGITVKRSADGEPLPFEDESFDLVINRHAYYDIGEVRRILKKGGHFITQQAGGENAKSLAQRVLPGYAGKASSYNLENQAPEFRKAGFKVVYRNQAYPAGYFTDVGALCRYACKARWAFPGFSVDSSFERLLDLQAELDARGRISFQEHRFIIVAKKI